MFETATRLDVKQKFKVCNIRDVHMYIFPMKYNVCTVLINQHQLFYLYCKMKEKMKLPMNVAFSSIG